eukprot:CAMPEP_0194250352 /NCGR_PEP_ID=MMETSP0158-20130606/22824_1 /TAXON_ID=33649 /ORGANISM="Thalassionema nitzschioides, Strain L26-B" /LENGTH=270 /DNA_ID=CAMNT_0038987137 /DNA_START=16 /DNA_END=828 /DNA_ORIENTATION=+
MTYMRKAGLTFLAMVLCFAIFANFGMNAVLQSIQILPEQGNILPEQGNKKDDEQYLLNGRATYLEAAKSLNPVTDKVTGHTYEIMYGKFLLPYYHRKPNMKMLEIGLGCDMGRARPGASVALYKKLFPEAELWEAEFDGECVKKIAGKGELEGIHTLVGDQGNAAVLDSWIEKSGGNFDVIIDDGGHQNCQIWQSFLKLWPTVKSGGLYFIEDMQVARRRHFRKVHTETCDGNLIVPDKLKEFFDELIYNRKSDIEFMFCQSEACVLGKR